MTYSCCVPGCRGNYKNGPKVHMFSFPSDADILEKWLTAINGQNFTPTKCSKVCELHFAKEQVIYFSTAYNSKTDRTVTARLKFPRLKREAVPTKFPKCTLRLLKGAKSSRKGRSKKFQTMERNNIATTMSLNAQIEHERVATTDAQSTNEFNKNSDFKDLLAVLESFQLPEHWFKIIDLQKVTLFKLKYSPGPIITYSVVINSILKVETFLYGQEIESPRHNVKTEPKTPFMFTNVDEIKDLLLAMDDNELEKCHSDHRNNILNYVSKVLQSLLSDKLDESSENEFILSFISEQLKLQTSCQGYRYSNNTMILASILHTISPHAYAFLRLFDVLRLPHPDTVKSICSSSLTDPTFEIQNLSLTHAKNLYKLSCKHERYVILLVDEIHVKSYLDHKAGDDVDSIYNNSCLADSVLVFLIASVTSSLKEVVHISPMSKIDHHKIFSLIKTIITKLEEIGYMVFCVVTDNNAVNKKAMSSFAENNVLSIVYPHPNDKTRPLFYLFDSGHLLEHIKSDWLNSKPDEMLHYPDFNTGAVKVAAFRCLKALYELEHDDLLKFDDTLSLKPLFYSDIERQNVALKIFNPLVVQALLRFGSKIDKSKDTAEFINIIVTWWKIVNVNTCLKANHVTDEYQEPITAANFSSDKKFVFLYKMTDWLETWKSKPFLKKLTPHTNTALSHTIYGMSEVIKYCFTELKINYVLLGKFQTDWERRFGKYRQLADGQKQISVRQSYETEKRLKILSLLTLKSRTFGNIHIMRFHAYGDSPDDIDIEDHLFNPDIVIERSDIDKVSDDMHLITYLASYCCYTILRKIRCDVCKQNLVYNDELIVEDNFSLIKTFGPGKLFYPQDCIVQIVLYSYIIFNKILYEYEEVFLSIHNKRQFLTQYILKFVSENGQLRRDNKCASHTSEQIAAVVITCITNTFLKSYWGKTNDRLSNT